MQKPEQNTRFSALKYFFQISFRCWGVRKTPGFVIFAKKGKNKWSSDETYIFSADRHLCLFHWRARFRNLGTSKMINQSGKSLPCFHWQVWQVFVFDQSTTTSRQARETWPRWRAHSLLRSHVSLSRNSVYKPFFHFVAKLNNKSLIRRLSV